MKVVVDTNVFISGVFFGGKPQRVLEKMLMERSAGCAVKRFFDEYREVVQRMIEKRKKGPALERFFNLYSDGTQILPQVVGKLFFVPWGHHRFIINK